jgi:hypothetical protein
MHIPHNKHADIVFLRAKELEVNAESLNATKNTAATTCAVEIMSAARYAAIINTEKTSKYIYI